MEQSCEINVPKLDFHACGLIPQLLLLTKVFRIGLKTVTYTIEG